MGVRKAEYYGRCLLDQENPRNLTKIKLYIGFRNICFTIIPKPKSNLILFKNGAKKKAPSTTKTLKIKFSSEIFSVHMNISETLNENLFSCGVVLCNNFLKEVSLTQLLPDF